MFVCTEMPYNSNLQKMNLTLATMKTLSLTCFKHTKGPTCHVPLIGDVAAGTDVLAQENVEEVLPLPADLTGEGELFMLRVRGDSMIEAGILDGDYVVVRREDSANSGDIVVAGIPGDEATVKKWTQEGSTVTLVPANSSLEPMRFDAAEVNLYGRVVTVLRRL